MTAEPSNARGDVRGLVAKLAAHVRPTCSELWDEAQALLAAEGVQAEPKAEARGVVDGVALIEAERRRQVETEGWTPEHDDEHEDGAMAHAAACYAYGSPFVAGVTVWPWSADWWKPSDRIRDLAKAGALIAAEIDRLQRAALTEARNVR